jgi:hypothetical protein
MYHSQADLIWPHGAFKSCRTGHLSTVHKMLILEVQNHVEVQTSKERVELWLAQLFIDNGKARVELWLAKLFIDKSKARVELWLAQLIIDNGEARLNCGWLCFSSTTSKAKVELWLAKLFIDNVKASKG